MSAIAFGSLGRKRFAKLASASWSSRGCFDITTFLTWLRGDRVEGNREKLVKYAFDEVNQDIDRIVDVIVRVLRMDCLILWQVRVERYLLACQEKGSSRRIMPHPVAASELHFPQ